MSDIKTAARLEPAARTGSASPARGLNDLTAPAGEPATAATPEPQPPEPPKPAKPVRTTPERAGADQLARIEDKAARIEDKLARSEGRMQRVVDKVDEAVERMRGVAQQADLAAVRNELSFVSRRVRNLPGLPSIILVSALTALFTAAAMLALFRYAPWLLSR
jgi:hypothetical protein